MEISLAGKIAWVTGAGEGIGRAISLSRFMLSGLPAPISIMPGSIGSSGASADSLAASFTPSWVERFGPADGSADLGELAAGASATSAAAAGVATVAEPAPFPAPPAAAEPGTSE